MDHCGKFSSYTEAAAAVPYRLQGGWTNSDVVAADYFQPAVYASLYWIAQCLKPKSVVVDLGGASGHTYYHLAKRHQIPDGVRWHVVDLPQTIARGAKLAQELGATHLTFGTSLRDIPVDVERFDVLHSSGCMQYMPETPDEILGQLPGLPRHVLLNYMPIIDGPSFWTLESLMHSAAPYRIFNETELLKPFTGRGFAISDRWPAPELSCAVPFYPECHVRTFTGLYLARTGVAHMPA
jgi:putative methyltransferase (TIGR04325 family)